MEVEEDVQSTTIEEKENQIQEQEAEENDVDLEQEIIDEEEAEEEEQDKEEQIKDDKIIEDVSKMSVSIQTTNEEEEEEKVEEEVENKKEEEEEKKECNNSQQPIVEEKSTTTTNKQEEAKPIVSSVSLHHGAKLIQVTGSQEPFSFITVPLSQSSLNLSDAFIMQSDAYMFVWSTDKCHSQKKAKAIQMAQKLKVEIGCQRAVMPFEYGEEHLTFLYCLGVPKGEKLIVKTLKSESMLDENGDELEPELFLYRVGKVDGKLNVIPIQEEEIVQEMFDSASCFILDCELEIYVWQGEKSSKAEREVSVTLAKRFLTMFERPANTSISCVFDGAEGCLFKSKFKVWKESEKHMQSYLGLSNKKKEMLTFDVAEMHVDKEVPQISLGSDDHKGKLLVWSCASGGAWKKVEEDDFGIFYSNRSYVCHFIYKPADKNSIKSVIFYWEGCYASSRSYVSYKFGLYKDIQKKMQSLQSDDPVEYRIAQNKEPNEFYNLFGSETIVLNEELSLTKPVMFQVRGADGRCRGTQVDLSASRLCSLDAFTIIIPTKAIMVWYGKACNDAERRLASELFTFLPPEFEAGVKEIEEGEEPESFWKLMGGRTEYPDIYDSKPAKSKLFVTSEASGIFKADEAKPFSQVDLNTEENAILDRHQEIYVWRGKKTTDSKFNQTLALAQLYKESAQDERPQDSPITVINEGEETLIFKSSFISWKQVQVKVFVDPWEIRKQKEKEQQQKEKELKLLEQEIEKEKEKEKIDQEVEKKEEVVEEEKKDEVEVEVEQNVIVKEEIKVEETKVEDEQVKEEDVQQQQEQVKEVEEEDKEVEDNSSPQIVVTPDKVKVDDDQVVPSSTTPKTGYKDYKEDAITISSNGDLLFAFDIPTNNNNSNNQNSPKQGRKGGKKKKPRHRSLSQNSTPVSTGSPISKSCELPIPEASLSSPIITSQSSTSSTSTSTTTTTHQGSPHFRRKQNRHNRTGSYGSPRK